MPYDGDTFLAGLAVYVVLRNNDGKVFLLRRTNSSFKNGYYSLPAGRVEQKENFMDAAIRETYEEAGVTLKAENLRLYSVITRLDTGKHADWADLFFEASTWEGEPHVHEVDKFDHGDWFSKEEMTKIPFIENQMDGLQDIDKDGISYRFADFLEPKQ